MLVTKPYVPDVYGGGSDVNARGEARNLSLVLDEKFKYLGGKDIKPPEQAKDQKAAEIANHFASTYNGLPDSGDAGATVYSNLSSILPDISTRNIHILAAAQYIVNRIRERGLTLKSVEDLDPKDFNQVFELIWPKLDKAIGKKNGAKRDLQIQDVFKYVIAILNFESQD